MNSVNGNINYYAITLCRATTEEDLEVRITADGQEQQANEAKFHRRRKGGGSRGWSPPPLNFGLTFLKEMF